MSPWSETPSGSWSITPGELAVNAIRQLPAGGAVVSPDSFMRAPRYGASGPSLFAK